MYYAPQPWLADWSALTDEIVRANEDGEDNMPAGVYERKAKTRICEVCGAEYTSRATASKYCPDCAKEKRAESWAKSRAKQAESWAKRRAMQDGESTPDVPDVPADDYDTLADKIKKTAPIETVLVPKKEDKEMDTERAERLKSFPSMSNRLEHPEYFTGDTPESLGQTKTVPADNGTALEKPDRKRRLMDLYGTLNAYCESFGVAASDVLDRLRKIDEALS